MSFLISTITMDTIKRFLKHCHFSIIYEPLAKNKNAKFQKVFFFKTKKEAVCMGNQK